MGDKESGAAIAVDAPGRVVLAHWPPIIDPLFFHTTPTFFIRSLAGNLKQGGLMHGQYVQDRLQVS